MKLLAKKPEDRFATAAEVRLALGETLLTPAKHRARVRRTASLFASAAMAVSLGVVGVSYRAMHPAQGSVAVSDPLPVSAATAEVVEPRLAAPPATGTALIEETPAAPPALSIPEGVARADAPLPKPTFATTPVLAALLASAGTKRDPAPRRRRPSPASPVPRPPPASAPGRSRARRAAREPLPRGRRARLAPQPHSAAERADLAELADARTFAKDHASDHHALKSWAIAASRAGAMREARRAGEAWALKDDTVEPRLFLATVLEATGRAGDAKNIMDQWLEVHPESSEARKLEARLALTALKAERVMHKTVER